MSQPSADPAFLYGKRVLVTGGSGFVGRSLLPKLRAAECAVLAPPRSEYDLLEQEDVRRLFREARPEVVYHLAALSGGILANKTYPAEFCYRNLLMNTLVLHESWRTGVRKYVTLIGGCSYPAAAASPIAEADLWNGYPQPESAPYSVAKKTGIVMSDAYRAEYGFDAITLVPGNLYGPGDNYDLRHSHVIPAAIRKFHEAIQRGDGQVVMWGSGKPVRDFVYVEDVCEAMVVAANVHASSSIINISSGIPVSIRELITTIADLSGYRGTIAWDESKPDGQAHKVFDVRRMHDLLDYRCTTSLTEGLRKTIKWFAENYDQARLDFVVE